jgi:hypothetical protein
MFQFQNLLFTLFLVNFKFCLKKLKNKIFFYLKTERFDLNFQLFLIINNCRVSDIKNLAFLIYFDVINKFLIIDENKKKYFNSPQYLIK